MHLLKEKLFKAIYNFDNENLIIEISKELDSLDFHDDTGLTPITSAIFDGDESTVKILLKLGADPNFREKGIPETIGYSPLERAIDFDFPEIEKTLLEYGAKE